MTDPTPAKLNIDQLLRMGVSAARSGNRSSARALFLALTHECPHDVRPWLGLAGVAASAQEQRDALEHVVAISPGHPQAQQALASLAPPAPAHQAPSPPPAATGTPIQPPAAPRDLPQLPPPDNGPAQARQRFPLMNMIALAIMGLLIIALLVVARGLIAKPEQRAAEATIMPSSVLLTATPPPTTAAPATSITQPPAPDTAPSAAQLGTATAAQVAPTVAATPPAAGLPAPASLPLGTIVDVDGWSATLLRPDYALILDGTIGDLKPSGRFVLALMAISNNSADLRRIPADLLTIVDSRGRRYSPAPNASSAYLSLYGRGQHGDLALEDAITPRSGMRSVPILFDVPDDATGMVLTIRDSGMSGWPIEGAAIPATNVGP